VRRTWCKRCRQCRQGIECGSSGGGNGSIQAAYHLRTGQHGGLGLGLLLSTLVLEWVAVTNLALRRSST